MRGSAAPRPSHAWLRRRSRNGPASIGPASIEPAYVKRIRAVCDLNGLEWLVIVGAGLRPTRVARADLARDLVLRAATLDFVDRVPPDRLTAGAAALVTELRDWGHEMVETTETVITPWW